MGYTSDMPSYPGLQRLPSGRYRLRRVVPQQLQRFFDGKKNKTYSLTHDPKESLKLAKLKSIDFDAEVDRAWARLREAEGITEKRNLSSADIDRLVLTVKHSSLSADEDARLRGDRDRLQSGRNAIDALYTDFAKAVATGDYREIQPTIDTVLEDGGYADVDREDVSYLKARQAIANAVTDAWDDIEERERGRIVPTPAEPSISHTLISDTPLLSVAGVDFVAEHRKKWADKTRDDHEAKLRLFIEVVGDQPINEVGRQDGLRFREVIAKLPANWMKKPQLRGLNVVEASDKAEQLTLMPMSDTNITKHVNRIGQLFNWAVYERNHWGVKANPLSRLQIKVSVMVNEQRDPFSIEQLQSIFNAPTYTGCKSIRGWRQTGDLVPRNSGRFWLPILGLYTGGRANELAQIYVDDVIEEGGVVGLDISDKRSDQRLKNPGSRRFIPLHPHLIRMGFVEHVDNMRTTGQDRVFPDIELAPNGYYSTYVTRWFNDSFLRSINAKTDKTSFHSFRHCYENALKDAEVYGEWIDCLQGHKVPGMRGRYGNAGSAKRLHEAVCKISYEGLDLSHLMIS
jgi:integrase